MIYGSESVVIIVKNMEWLWFESKATARVISISWMYKASLKIKFIIIRHLFSKDKKTYLAIEDHISSWNASAVDMF